jgi:flagellar motility protein MotE (MotC chaperone)
MLDVRSGCLGETCHLKDELVAHFSLLAVSHKRQQEEIQAYQEEMKALEKRKEEEMKTMRGEIEKLKKRMSSHQNY